MNENQFKSKGFLVLGISTLFFLYEFFIRTVTGTYQFQIMNDLNLTSFQFSLLSTTIFMLIYGIMQIPAGLIVDNIGLKKTLLIAALACSIASIGFATSHSFALAILYRMLMGFGASFGFISMLISIYDWIPHRYFGIFIGLTQFIGTLGPMVAAGPLDSISESAGISWRFIFFCLAGVGFFLTVLIFLFVENNQEKAGRYIVLHKPEKILTSLLRLFSRTQPWCIAIFSACIYFTVEYLSENEGRAFLGLKGISLNTASYMITISWIGFALGCPLVGFLSDFFKRRKIIMTCCGLLGLVSILMIIISNNKLCLQASFFILGISATGQGIGFAVIAEQFKKQFVAVGFGLNNAIVIITMALNAPLIGLLLDRSKQGSDISMNNYMVVFIILVIFAVIALIMSIFFIKETYCKSAVDFTYLNPSPDERV